MKKINFFKMVAFLISFSGLSAFATAKAEIRCQNNDGNNFSIDLSELNAPSLASGINKNMDLVVSRDESVLTLTGVDLESFQMTSIEFKVADLQIQARGSKTIKGILNVAEGPGSAFKASDLVCVMNDVDRIRLLSLKSNSKW